MERQQSNKTKMLQITAITFLECLKLKQNVLFKALKTIKHCKALEGALCAKLEEALFLNHPNEHSRWHGKRWANTNLEKKKQKCCKEKWGEFIANMKFALRANGGLKPHKRKSLVKRVVI